MSDVINTHKAAFVWGGIPAVGLADGDAIKASFDNDETSAYAGVRGEGALVSSKDKRGTITVMLQGNSPSISAYEALYKSVTNGEQAAPSFIYKKRVGIREVAFTGTCLLTKLPEESTSREMPVVELVFVSGDMEKTNG